MRATMNERSPAKRGAVLSVVGPVGVGKSTLIDAIVKGALQDQEILRIRNVGLLPRRTLPQVPVTEPHKGPVGVGKSTLIDAIVKGALQDQEILRIRNVGLLPRRTLPQVPVTEPHKDP